jgi:hypothetical protein
VKPNGFSVFKYVMQIDKLAKKNITNSRARFSVDTAETIRIAVFWLVMSYSLVEIFRRFEGTVRPLLKNICLFLNINQLDALNFITYRCDGTRDCIIQFCPPDHEHMCSKHVEA